MIMAAFGAESTRLSQIVTDVDDASFTHPSPCAPWTAGELLFHVQMTMERLDVMLAEPEPDGSGLVTAAGYYRADRRFSADANAERIASAQRGAACLPGAAAYPPGAATALPDVAVVSPSAAARADAFRQARYRIWSLLQTVPPGRIVRTRHGDRMPLTEFLRTRVLELAVHGLDLAAALDRPPWMTAAAAEVVEQLLLPDEDATRLRSATGWDQLTLIAKLTGRTPATPAQTRLIDSLGVRPLAFG
ncbi:MAG TPA: maleylpyruvate isomerase N-terminal domain-containing protein [Streptosporangiaceae bacterium]|jgi:uncharacterized protein (TIGR03083 family)